MVIGVDLHVIGSSTTRSISKDLRGKGLACPVVTLDLPSAASLTIWEGAVRAASERSHVLKCRAA